MSDKEHFQKGLDEVMELERKLKAGVDVGATVDKSAVDSAEAQRTVKTDTMGDSGQPVFQLVDGHETVAVSKTGKARMDAEQIAEKPKESKVEQAKLEKLIPKDGETIPLAKLLTDYKTPFIDAYEHSKKLKDGEPGKSLTLESLVERLKHCPWATEIRVRFDSNTDHPEYSNADSTITISPRQSPWKQIQTFAHEGFHATHQSLTKLWIEGPAKTAQEFAALRAQLEVGAFEAEIKVYQELTRHMPDSKPVEFQWWNQYGVAQAEKNLVKLYETGGRSAIERFVVDEAYSKTSARGETNFRTYRQYYESGYDKYLKTFDNDRRALLKRYPEPAIRSGNY